MGFKFRSKKGVSSFSVIFDLDGTLIDSQESILNSIKQALSGLGIEPKIPISSEIIGPPLLETLSVITGENDQLTLSAIASHFKAQYDDKGCKESIAYKGVDQLLKNLVKNNCNLYIATNKRLEPTQKIISHLGWTNFFKKVYCIDLKGANKMFSDKAEMLSSLLSAESINLNAAVYVGDRFEDYEAANANNLRCLLVNWGYGEIELNSNSALKILSNLDELEFALIDML